MPLKKNKSAKKKQEKVVVPADLDIIGEFEAYLGLQYALAPGSRETYRVKVQMFHRWLEQSGTSISEITVTDLIDFKAYIYRKYKASTANGYLIAVRKFCRFLVEKKYHQFDISAADQILNLFGEQDPLAPRSLSTKEINAVRHAADMLKNIRYNIVLELGLCAGLRVEEIASLRFEDIKLNEKSGKILVRGKGSIQRKADLSDRLLLYFHRFYALFPEENRTGCLFPGRSSGEHISRVTLFKWIQNIGRLANVKLHPHMLRHTFCTVLAKKGRSLAEVMILAGHRSIRTTVRYIQPSEEDLADAIKDL